MPSRPHLTTTGRGYGWTHQQAKAEACRRYRPGQPCVRCHQPMRVADPRTLHLDHTDDRRGYRGLAHPRCNTRAGQAKSVQARTGRTAPATAPQHGTKRSRNW